ncbi:hypothetical protein [Geothrix sp. 21YS21S-2]|uniref:hypothetical protein n=1 Tax=Geothrix sp. 21YS21S-2 TaxID=3068893 RepID=UPI0027B8C7B8|nr:hypothetical protein [Geothrix sp. 21YS21S-2]
MRPLVLFLSVPCLLTNMANAQALWKEARAGMSTKELLKTIKGLVPNPEDSPLSDGSTSPYILKDVMLDGESFTAMFYIKNDKLKQVHLSAPSEIGRASAVNTYSNLFKSLSDKYGMPKRTDVASFTRKEMIWILGKIDITLLLISSEDGKLNFLKIIYGTRLTKERENL